MKEQLKGQRGASIVEFAIVLPLLLLLVFGIIEFGLLLYNKAMVTNASREGARAGIVYRENPPGTYSPLSLTGPSSIETVVKSYTSMNLVTFASGTTTPTITGTSCVTALRGGDLTVTVAYPYTFLVFDGIAKLIGSGALPGTITLSAETVMRCQ